MNIIDRLVVELSLDPKLFTKGQQEALDAARKSTENLRKGATGFEEQARRISQGFASIRNQALGLLALFVGGRGLSQFVQFITTTDAATGRLAYRLETSTELLSRWGGAAERVGGDAKAMAGSVAGLVRNFQMFAITGQSDIIPYFRALGVEISDAEGKMRPFNDIFLDLADRFRKMGPARAATFGQALGFDEGTINLLLLGREAVAKILADQEHLSNVSKKNAEQAGQLQDAWVKAEQSVTSVGRTLLNTINPALVTSLGWVSQIGSAFNGWLQSSDTWVDKLDRNLGGALSAVLGSPKRASIAERFGGFPTSASGGPMSRAETEAYIRAAAVKRGIDPNVALEVARREGLGSYVGDRGSSFGPFQMHYGGVARGGNAVSGLGDVFSKQTGLDARDPATVRQQVDFSLDWAKLHGWGAWHGVRGMQGSGGAGKRSEVNIGQIVVNVPSGDPDAIARGLKPAIEGTMAGTANYGPN